MLKGIKQIVKQCFANVPATVTQNFYRRFNFFCRNITIPICSLKNSYSSHYVKTYAFSNSSCVNFIKKNDVSIYCIGKNYSFAFPQGQVQSFSEKEKLAEYLRFLF